MRKIISMAAAVVLLSFSFLSVVAQDDSKDGDHNGKTKIVGNGHVITREVNVRSFDYLVASGVFSVSLKQGDKEALSIEAEENLQPLFEVKDDGGKLIVGMQKDSHFKCTKRMRVYITFKTLKNLDLKMVGNLLSEGNLNFEDLSLENQSVGSVELALNARKLHIRNDGVGNLRLSGKADNAIIRNNSVGSIKAGNLLVQTIDIDNDGIGAAEVNAEKELLVRDSFLGRVRNVNSSNPKRIKKVVI